MKKNSCCGISAVASQAINAAVAKKATKNDTEIGNARSTTSAK